MSKVSLRNARVAFADIVNQAAFSKERVVLTKNGKDVAAVVPFEDFRILEALEDKADLDEARRRLAKPGKTVSLADLKKSFFGRYPDHDQRPGRFSRGPAPAQGAPPSVERSETRAARRPEEAA